MAKNLTAFLAQNAKKVDNVTFIASDRFVDPDTGEAMPRGELRLLLSSQVQMAAERLS